MQFVFANRSPSLNGRSFSSLSAPVKARPGHWWWGSSLSRTATHSGGDMKLRTLVLALPVVAVTAFSSFVAQADSQLDALIKNSSNWAAQAGDYSNHRYSPLKQVNESNVAKLQVAWTVSTGVLRGHEGSPLVIGDIMYIHSPFPNKWIAISLQDQTLLC